YRERGYFAGAIVNHLFRLGHSTSENAFLTLEEMARLFEPERLGRAPARFDEQQLKVWQKAAVHRLSDEEAWRWLAPVVPEGFDERSARAFVEAVRPNVVLPEDARAWAEIVFGELP